MRGDSTTFSQDVFDNICDMLAEGKSLRTICLSPDMPNKGTVFRWLAKDEALSDQYARAREMQADSLFDDCLQIADQYDPDERTAEGGMDHIQRARLRIDTRKWMAGKLRPKRYGEKIAIGGDKDMDPIKTEEVGIGASKLAALMDSIAERSGTAGEPDA